MTLSPEIIKTLNEQTARIIELQQQVSALQYIVTQCLTVALRLDPDQQSTLQDLQVFFAEKALASGITADSGDAGFDLAVNIFTSVKASL